MSTTMEEYVAKSLVEDLRNMDTCKDRSQEQLVFIEKAINHLSYLTNVFGKTPYKDAPFLKSNAKETMSHTNSESTTTVTVYELLRTKSAYDALLYMKKIKQIRTTKREPLKRVYIINGAGGAGKDTFVEIYKRNTDKVVHNVSTVDKVKQAAFLLGWDGVKNEQGRRVLHELKRLSVKEFDGPLEYVLERINAAGEEDILFVHIREPEEITTTVNTVRNLVKNVSVGTILIRSDRAVTYDNGADNVVENYEYTDIIDNYGTLAELEEACRAFMTVTGVGVSE